MGLAITGDKLPATPRRRDWGLIWDLADDPLAAAMRAGPAAWPTMPTQALVATRALLHECADQRTLDAHLDVERDTQSAMGSHARLHRRRQLPSCKNARPSFTGR
jgi:2-(1,2-epoxy-1,2-dihydrophenyl)acetyl-CoA isomerase